MNKYELALILRPDMDEESLKAELAKVEGYITRFGGTIDKVDAKGKKRLAYEIKKCSEGVYYFIYFTSVGSTPREVEDRIRILENVLRYLIIRQDS